ncbi:MAG: hypothetical protein KGN16_17735 [Burkholderiales bacterium]|nr:hypothetical protein [Burkholderiales bacterium]
MKSKHALWQSRWQLDPAAGLAVHDGGLRVRLQGDHGIAENAAEVEQSLVAEHGAHNAGAMVQRLAREGAQLLIDPHARGWREGGDKRAGKF